MQKNIDETSKKVVSLRKTLIEICPGIEFYLADYESAIRRETKEVCKMAYELMCARAM